METKKLYRYDLVIYFLNEILYIILDSVILYLMDSFVNEELRYNHFYSFRFFSENFEDRSDGLAKSFPHYGYVSNQWYKQIHNQLHKSNLNFSGWNSPILWRKRYSWIPMSAHLQYLHWKILCFCMANYSSSGLYFHSSSYFEGYSDTFTLVKTWFIS